VYTFLNPNSYGTPAGDYFGESVAIFGNYAIVGAPNEDDSSQTQSGRVYVYNLTNGSLYRTLNNPGAAVSNSGAGFPWNQYDFFGYALAMDTNFAVVGAYHEDNVEANEGKVYIFKHWSGILADTLQNPNGYNTAANDQFGKAVAISGNYILVGAPGEADAGGNGSGKAYIFKTLGNWEDTTLLHTLDNPSPHGTSGSYFGWSVAISGNYAVVGALNALSEDGSMYSGKAYIFDVTTGELLHALDNPNPYGTSATDQFGSAVAISGNSVVISARLEDDAGGNNSGKTYIYHLA
jgi:hypothetical protein